MRLWPYQFIDVLPSKHLVAQFREAIWVYSSLKENGKVNHCIVNKVENYPLEEMHYYCFLVAKEMNRRGFKTAEASLKKMDLDIETILEKEKDKDREIFKNWHSLRYVNQCLFMFQERLDCGMIKEEEFLKIKERFIRLYGVEIMLDFKSFFESKK